MSKKKRMKKKIKACSECDYKAPNENILRNHNDNVHKGVKRFSCNLCIYTSFYKHLVTQHQKHQHKGLDGKIKRIWCDKCDQVQQHGSCLSASDTKAKTIGKSKVKHDSNENERAKYLIRKFNTSYKELNKQP